MQPFVSVVVPTYNRVDSLLRLIEALGAQTYPVDRFEMVIVDDGSTDGTLDTLGLLRTRVHLRVVEQAHGGPAQARNLGVRAATGDLIVFVDDDVRPDPNLLAEHVRAHAHSVVDSVVIGPMLPPRRWRRPAWVRWEEDTLQVQYRDMLAGKYPCTPRQFYTANVSLPRARFLAVGGFDPGFKRAEDVELAYRLRDAGAHFVFHPAAEVRHYASRTLAAWLRIPYQYGRYDVVMARDKSQETLQCATFEFHGRNRLTRWLVRACLGRPRLSRLALTALGATIRAADRLLLPARAVNPLLSATFNLLYWQGAADELGGPGPTWEAIAAGARLVTKPRLVPEAAAAQPTLN